MKTLIFLLIANLGLAKQSLMTLLYFKALQFDRNIF